MTANLMSKPGGQWLVAVGRPRDHRVRRQVAWRGWTEKFAENLDTEGKIGTSGAAYLLFGKVGHIGKGVALAIVGGLFVYAGVTHESRKSGGLDEALTKVLQQPFGQVLLLRSPSASSATGSSASPGPATWTAEVPRQRFTGRIAGVGSTSGVRIVVGRWATVTDGPFADVMLAEPDGTRVLLAPDDEVADLVSTTYPSTGSRSARSRPRRTPPGTCGRPASRWGFDVGRPLVGWAGCCGWCHAASPTAPAWAA